MFKSKNAFSSFSVNDSEKARKFYTETLGLKVNEVPDMDGLLDINIGNGGKVMVYTKPNHEPASFTVLNFEVDNVADSVKDLKGKGVAFESYNTKEIKTDENNIAKGDGQQIAWFKDPAGNIMSVMSGG